MTNKLKLTVEFTVKHKKREVWYNFLETQRYTVIDIEFIKRIDDSLSTGDILSFPIWEKDEQELIKVNGCTRIFNAGTNSFENIYTAKNRKWYGTVDINGKRNYIDDVQAAVRRMNGTLTDLMVRQGFEVVTPAKSRRA